MISRRWATVYALILIGMTSLPYLVGYQAAREGWVFTGFVFGVEDGNSYIAKMLRGAEGEWLFRTPYSAAPQAGMLAFLPYLLLGKVAAGPGLHEQLVALFHLFRSASILLLVYAILRFTGLFLDDLSWRRWCVILSTAGGGLGWVLVLAGRTDWLGSLPLEFYSPESFGFLEIFGLPHLAAARALLLLAFTNHFQPPDQSGNAWRTAFLLLGAIFFQPLTGATGLFILLSVEGVALLRRTRPFQLQPLADRLWGLGPILAMVVPSLAYYVYLSSRDPFVSLWTEQNRILSPHPLHYVLSYALMLLPAVVGAQTLFREERHGANLLPLIWVVLLPFLAYAPHNLQRRLPEGVWIAWVLLAALGLQRIRSPGRARWLGRLILVMSIPSALLLVAGGLRSATQPSEPIFRPEAEVRAFQVLQDVAAFDAVVLASFQTGNALPAWSPQRVVVGHGPESVNLAALQKEIEAFFDAQSPDSLRRDFLQEAGVEFVFYGPSEQRLGSWDPAGADFLIRLHQEEGYSIFRVLEPRLASYAGPP